MNTRKIGPVLATFVVANNMIGSGFFLLPATLATSGAVTVFSWVIGTALALMLGGAYARLARDYPNRQSSDDYVRPSLGRDASVLASSRRFSPASCRSACAATWSRWARCSRSRRSASAC